MPLLMTNMTLVNITLALSLNHTDLNLNTPPAIDITAEKDILYNMSSIFANDSYLYDEVGIPESDNFFNLSRLNTTIQPLDSTVTTIKSVQSKKVYTRNGAGHLWAL